MKYAKAIVLLLSVSVLSVASISYAVPNEFNQKRAIAKLLNSSRPSSHFMLSQSSSGGIAGHVRYSSKNGYLCSLGAPEGHFFPVRSAVLNDPAKTALNFLAENPEAFCSGSASLNFRTGKIRTKDERHYVRLVQAYADIPVFAAETVIQLNLSGGVESLISDIMSEPGMLDNGKISLTPSIKANDAERSAIVYLAKGRTGLGVTASRPELMIYDPAVIGDTGAIRLVWSTKVTSPKTHIIDERVLVDAHTSEIAFHYPLNPDALNRKVYDSSNTSSDPGTLRRSEGQSAWGITDVDNAYDYLGDAYKFYFDHHGRDGIDGLGMAASATVRYSLAAGNAYWSTTSERFYFGTGFAVDDVVGHELTHGVTQHESGLIYSYESGAINESFSDIWGEFIDLENGVGNDTDSVRWLLGEDLPVSTGVIRNMANPPVYDQPDRMGSALWYSGSSDNGGVHTNSGVGNKLAYLLTDGGAFNGYTVEAMGINRVAELFYEVQANLLTSGAAYSDLGIQLKQAAINLGWNAADRDNLLNALKAVEIEAMAANFILTWGVYGTGNGKFNFPHGISSGPDGYIYVVDKYNNYVQKFTKEGVFIKRWGSYGSGNGQFDWPMGICSDSQGNIYVTDSDNYRVQKFTSEGIFVKKWGSMGTGDGKFNEPFDICADNDGYVYVTDAINNCVQKFTQDGVFIAKWGSSGSASGQFNTPHGICVDPQGNIFVADSYNYRAQKFSPDGTFLMKWGSYGSADGKLNSPCGITADAQGDIYVSDTSNNRIQKFAKDGTFISKWGIRGTGPGQFKSPYGICSDIEGNIYVADKDNRRIQKFGNTKPANDNSNILSADMDGNGQKDVIINFGAGYGVWVYYNDSSWAKLHEATPALIRAGNVDGDSDGLSDIIVDFGPIYGIWIYYNNSTWQELHNTGAESITPADLDNNGMDDIVVDFGAQYGIWIYYNNSSWVSLHGLNPETIVAGNFDNNGGQDIVVDFGSQYGAWIYYNNSTWELLHTESPDHISEGDLDGDGTDDLVFDFGTQYGIWAYYNNVLWARLHTTAARSIAVCNMDADSRKDVIINFGAQHGIWVYLNNSTWWKLHSVSPEEIAAGDINADGIDEIIVDFGPQLGIWVYQNDTSWRQLHSLSIA